MYSLSDWHNYVVLQKHSESGCIPWSFEFLLRFAGVTDIAYNTFQTDFDFDKDKGKGEAKENGFPKIVDAVMHKYSHVSLKWKSFDREHGRDKVEFVEKMIRDGRGIVLSLNILPVTQERGWHIMPVVEIAGEEITMVYGVNDSGEVVPLNTTKSEIIAIHKNCPGGREVAWLDSHS